jgi:lipoprotein signal peptidase
MKKFFTKGRIALLVIFSVLIIDQVIKVIVKTQMYWHESIRITDWFYIYFTENNDIREIVPYFISNRCGRSDRLVPV